MDSIINTKIKQLLNKNKTSRIISLLDLSKELQVRPELFEQDDTALQKIIAPILRARAVNHLRKAQTATAKRFRGDCLPAIGEAYEQYLQHQSKKGSWGTDVEAVAIGESLGCNVVVTSRFLTRSDITWCLHLESEDAPTIHLYNDNNYHWTNSPDSMTLGDGDCLYHAIAKSLKNLVLPAKNLSAHSSHSIFQRNSTETLAIKKQIMIANSIQKAVNKNQSAAEFEKIYEKEKLRISCLSKDEQEQIAKDYRLALYLARNIEPKTYDEKTVIDNHSHLR